MLFFFYSENHNHKQKWRAHLKTTQLFEIQESGLWLPQDIKTTILTESGETLMRSTESEEAIEAGWQESIAAGFKPWPDDLKPTLHRFVNYRRDGNRIDIILDPCLSYRDIIGSRSSKFKRQFDSKFHPRPLAVTTVLIAKNARGEEQILITLRDNTQDVKPGGFHVSTAGAAKIGRDRTPTEAAYREALEECGAERREISDLSLRAIVFGPWTLHMEMIYFAKLAISTSEIMSRNKHDKKDIVVFIPKDIGVITRLLLGGLHAAVPVGAAALVLLGENLIGGKLGADWRMRMEAFVRGASTSYSALSEGERNVADILANKALKGLIL